MFKIKKMTLEEKQRILDGIRIVNVKISETRETTEEEKKAIELLEKSINDIATEG